MSVFINEFHYDNSGTDSGEFIELVGLLGLDLTGWSLILYNGATGVPYNTIDLSGQTFTNPRNGFGFVTIPFPTNGIQNGSPDGIALIDNSGNVVQFLSYEGSFTAVSGPAEGLTTTDIGVLESSDTRVGASLQLIGIGSQAEEFTWTVQTDDTPGEINSHQTFVNAKSTVVLNEIYASHTGTDDTEFIELFGIPQTSLDGLSLIVVEGDSGLEGTIDRRIDFDATHVIGDNSFFLIGNPIGLGTNYGVTPDLEISDNFLENSSQTFALVETSSLSGTTVTGSEAVLDAVALRDGDIGDTFFFGTPVIGPDGSFFPAGARRVNDGVDTDQASDWVISDFFLGSANTPTSATTGGSVANVIINEIDSDTPGTDSVEFIELYDGGVGNTSLDGLVVVLYNGNGDVSYNAIDLDGQTTNPEGFFVIGSAMVPNVDLVAFTTNSLQNGADAVALYAGDASDFPSGTPVTSSNLIDAIAYGTNDADDAELLNGLGQTIQFNENSGPNGDDNDSLSRVPDATGSFIAQTPTPGSVNESSTPPPAEMTFIYEIQGTSHTSTLEGTTVTTTGIVTAVDNNGFYLQDPAGDGDIATSDGIFVFTNGAPGVMVGDELEVTGTVSEFVPGGVSTGNLSTTQISGPTISTLSQGNALPVATVIGTGGRIPPSTHIDDDAFTSFDPVNDGIDFFESLEGMLVTAEDLVAVSGTNRFGEIFAVTNQGSNTTGISQRGTLNISSDDFNPEKIQIDTDFDVSGFDNPEVNTGDSLGDVTGVISYDFGNFQIVPTVNFTGNIQSAGLTPETTTINNTVDNLTIATYNVLNLDPNDNDGDTDVADGRFDTIAQQIINNLNSPDIIGLQEIQDNSGSVDDGTVSADQTLQRLVDAIVDAGGPQYEFIDNTFITNNQSGGQPGGNIRTAYLYDPNQVSVASVQPIGSQVSGEPFNGARLPLAVDFEFQGEIVTVINNHFSSKGGSAPIFGVEQDFAARQEDITVNGSLNERREQAQAVNDFVDGVLSNDPNGNVVVLGDLNEFEFVSPLPILEGTLESTNNGQETITGGDAVLSNLVNNIAEDERYSFIFQGNSQQLDHILVSDSLFNNAEIDIVNINSEFAATESLASDHDPVLASFTFETPPNIIEGTRRSDFLLGTHHNDRITGFERRDIIISGGGEDTIVYTGLKDGRDILIDFQVGKDTIDLSQLLDEIEFEGIDPIAEGYLGFVSRGIGTLVTVDSDGFSEEAKSKKLLFVLGVETTELNNLGNFII
ncbi:hypothetical protein cce_4625 [Crocosphaera subtropica ATCC 51142]|uniref:LTD domain-containing protein n=1 Tax=Crocosphaera subtropica (strain ATCC 51142 / BH68) TaxID=43989 RepID=B1WVI3_CROS5|nr:endonuclease/exonuclease/phosphatase family protein [Crocosphaera subtropica]ACB53973.1 hypothetical protein cce_4625 [Crocosphaera subtropica ATCC 51142]